MLKNDQKHSLKTKQASEPDWVMTQILESPIDREFKINIIDKLRSVKGKKIDSM